MRLIVAMSPVFGPPSCVLGVGKSSGCEIQLMLIPPLHAGKAEFASKCGRLLRINLPALVDALRFQRNAQRRRMSQPLTSSVQTRNDVRVLGPKVVLIATSERLVRAIKTRPILGKLCRRRTCTTVPR